jgi:hypothetical protein
MPTIVCPQKTTPEWEALVNSLKDENAAHLAFFRNGNSIPKPDVAARLLGIKSSETPEQALSKYSSVKVAMPKGTTFLRLWVRNAKTGRDFLYDFVTKKNLEGGNVYSGTEITKIEAGIKGSDGKFIPSKEKPIITKAAKQASIETAAKAPEAETKPVITQTNQQLRDALPKSGLDESQQNLIRLFLDSKLASAMEGVRVRIADTLAYGWQGSYFQGVVQLARNSLPDTGVHEFAHRVWELLPDEVKSQFGQMRRDAIDAKLKQPMNYAQIGPLTELKENPTSGGQEFEDRGYPAEIYPYSSDEEFFTHSLSDQFSERLTASQQGIWQRTKQFFKDFWSAIKKFAGLNQTQNDILNNIINGRFKLLAGESEKEIQASLPPKEKEVPDTTQVMGAEKGIGGREHNTPESTINSVLHTKAVFDSAQVPSERVEIEDPRRMGADGKPLKVTLWKIDTSFDLNAEIKNKLIPLLEKDLLDHKRGALPYDLVANLIRSIQWNLETGNLSKIVDGKPVVDMDTRLRLLNLTTSVTSEWGRFGAALSAHSIPLKEVMTDPELHLQGQYYEMFGGDEVTSFVRRVLEEFGKSFTDEELASIAKSRPEMEALINNILAKNARDEGGRVYRIVQNLLKPRGKSKLKQLVDDARVREAANNIIEQAQSQGITPPKRQGRPLTAIEKLLDMIQPKNAEKINGLIKQAVADGEHNAGVKVALSKTRTTEEHDDLRGRFEAGEEPTREQIEEGLKLPEYAHWKIIRDNLLGYSPVTEKLASKIVPSVTKLARQIADTPGYAQPEMRAEFLQRLTDEIGLTDEDAVRVWNALSETYGKKFADAKQKAYVNAIKSMTPAEQNVMPRTDGKLWKRIERFFNAGGDKVSELLKQIAQLRGYRVPDEKEIAQMRSLVEREQQLRRIDPKAERAIRTDEKLTDAQKTEKIADLQAKLEASTAFQRVKLLQEIALRWSQMAKPIMKNIGQAGYEYATANMLTTLGFPVRLTEHIFSQLLVQTSTRPIGVAWHQFLEDRAAGRPTHAAQDVMNSVRGTLKATKDALQSAITNARAGFVGRQDMKGHIDRMMDSVNVMARIEAAANEYFDKGDIVRGSLTWLAGLPKFGIRVVQGLDAFSGTIIESQEMRNQIFSKMAAQGVPRYQIEVNIDKILGYIKEQRATARMEAKQFLDAYGVEHSETELDEATEKLLKRKMYLRIRELDLPSDSIEAYILRQRQAFAWQDPENVGAGGAITKAMMAARKFAQERGLPFLPVEFASAIGKSVNYKLMCTPLYRWADSPKSTDLKSAWFCSTLDRHVRQVQALAGTMAGSLVAYMILTGMARVNLHWPSDKKKREEWEAEGRRPGTVDFMLPNGDFIPMSLLVGPMALLSPTIAGVGAAKNLMDEREERQQKLDAIAKRTGLPAGKIPDLSPADFLGIAGESAWNTLFGGSAAAGMVGSYTEFQVPNVNKAVAATFSPFIPGLRAYQEMSRMMGVYMDPKMASVFDYLVPLPTSASREVNSLGDPVKTENDAQRIVQVLTAGSYPLPVNPNETPSPAYAAMFSAGWQPPAINPNKGFNVKGQYRPLNDEELGSYTAARGQYLKENLSGLGAGATKQEVQEAYQEANSRALAGVGAAILPRAASQRGAATAPARPAARRGARRVSLRGSSRTSKPSKIRIAKLRRPRKSHFATARRHVRVPRFRRIHLATVKPHRPRLRRPSLYS